MRYKLLGRRGVRLSEVCLGTTAFGDDSGGVPRGECARIVDAFVEAGGNFIDTAHLYTDGASDQIVGELVASDRDHWVVATRYGPSTPPDDPNAGGAHRMIVQQLERSLERLDTDYVDLYWLHVGNAPRSRRSLTRSTTSCALERHSMWASPIRRRGWCPGRSRSPNCGGARDWRPCTFRTA